MRLLEAIASVSAHASGVPADPTAPETSVVVNTTASRMRSMRLIAPPFLVYGENRCPRHIERPAGGVIFAVAMRRTHAPPAPFGLFMALPWPAALNLYLEREAQVRPDKDCEARHSHVVESRIDGGRAEDIGSDQEREPEKDLSAEVSPELMIGRGEGFSHA
jgi:hypothetical protein